MGETVDQGKGERFSAGGSEPAVGDDVSAPNFPIDRCPNILIFSQWFFPDGWSQLRDLAGRLAADGFHVEVLTAVPYSLADGKITPGYRIHFRQTEWIDGVRVIRLPLYISQSTSGWRRFLCYVSFGISAASLGQFGLTRPDVVFCYNLPTLGWGARLFRLLRGTKIVLMIQDLWPESVTNSGMMKNGLLSKILRRWSDRFYRTADALTGLSPGFKQNLTARGVDPSRIEVVYNWTNENTPLPSSRGERVPGEPFVVTYAGNMGIYQGLDVVLDAADILARQGENIRFRLIGGGVVLDALKERAATMKLDNLEFVPRVASDKISAEYGRSDALLIHLQKIDLFKITVPGKTQACLFAGRPILCGIEGEAARIIREAGAGYVFEPENPASLADAVLRMAALSEEDRHRMGESARDYYQKTMSFDAGYRTLSSLFRRLAKGKRRRV